MYNIAIGYLYIFWNDHRSKSSWHLSLYTVTEFFFLVLRIFDIYSLSNFHTCTTVLLHIFTMLYITPPGLIYFIIGSLQLLTPFTCFAHPSSLTLGNCQDILCISEFRFFFFLDSTYKWDHMVFVFLHLTYFTKHSALQGHPCCCKWHIYDFLLVLYILGRNNQ